MRWLADLAYLLAGILYSPVVLYHILVTGKHRTGWSQRFGCVPRRDLGKKRVWVHAVSLGEINATPKLVEALQRELPDHEFVFSTTTDTGYARAVQLYGHDRVFRFPLDFSWVIARALDRIRPSILVLMELEVWYNLTRIATRRGVRVIVANGRLTERSAKRFGWIAPLIKPMFADLAWVGAQDEPTAARFRAVGVRTDRIAVTSSLKWDTAVIADRIAGDDTLAASLGLSPGSPLWVCGSTGPGEEEMILDAFRRVEQDLAECGTGFRPVRTWAATPRHKDDSDAVVITDDRSPAGHHSERCAARNVQGTEVETDARPIRLAIVPRKPERFDDVARLIAQRGFACVRRSAHLDGASPVERAANENERPSALRSADCDAGRTGRPLILGDTMGELRKFYSLASVVFVGRSLVPMGGSDVMEVAALGKPIVVGPHTENFREAVACLRSADAIEIVDSAATLAESVRRLCLDAQRRAALGDRAREIVRRNQGATDRTVRGILSAIGRPAPCAESSALEKSDHSREHATKKDAPGKAASMRR